MKDGDARKTIINELRKNIFVVAGAGSGKTSMLVNRMVALIESGEATIDKICAITFTVNAAAEFLERLRKTLKRRSDGISHPNDNMDGGLGAITHIIQQRDKIALQNIDLCFAGTIDAFCNLILSEYPLNAEIPSSSSVLTDEDAARIYKNEYARLSIVHRNDDNFKAFVRLFRNPSSTFSNAIEDAIDVSFLNVQYVKPSKQLDTFVNDFKNQYEKALQSDIANIHSRAGLINTNNQTVVKEYDKFENQRDKFEAEWTLNTILSLPKFVKILANLTFTSDPLISGVVTYAQDGKLFKYDESSLTENLIKEIELMKYSYAMDFLLSCAQDVRKELKKNGRLTFNEYLFTFKELVKKDMHNGMSLIKHIRKKYTHFLIDESQDTSPFQYELFLFLNSSVPVNSIDDVKLIPGSVFIVGDPKQSIYRFRNADISSYNRIRKIFENPNNVDNMVVELTYNFRCASSLCLYFNDRFKNMENFTPIANAIKQKVESEGLYTYKDYVEVIKTLVDNPNFFILDENKNPRKLTYKDIMIITKAKTGKLSEIAKKLDSEGIPYFTEGDNVLSNYHAAEAVYAIYEYLANNKAPEFVLNLLTSPLFRLSKEEVLSRKDDFLNSANTIRMLALIDQIKTSDNPVILFNNIVDKINLFNVVSSMRLDYVYHLANLLEDAYASNKVLSLIDGAKFIKDTMLTPQERIAQLMYKPNAIYVANVHKVKGLEAPVVIIIKAGANNKEQEEIQKHMDYINEKSYVFRISKQQFGKATFFDAYDTFTYPNLIDEEFNESKKEFQRLQYVAVTRARNLLFINGEKNYNVWFDLITSDFKEFEPKEFINEELEEEQESGRQTVPQNHSQTPNKATGSFEKEKTYNIVLPSKLKINHEGQVVENEVKNELTKSAAEKGTLIHALLEIYVTSDMKYSKDDVVNETLARYGQSDNDSYRTLLTNVIETMLNGGYMQSSGQKEDLFAILKNADEIYCELPFSYKEGDNIYNGSIDLFYRIGDKYYIVDYKTNYDGENLEQRYEAQLKAYQKAVKEIEGIDASARIYHISER